MKWLALEVGCAECADGARPLIEAATVYDSLDEAKAAEAGNSWLGVWYDRKGGGVYSHGGSGGVEIIPVP